MQNYHTNFLMSEKISTETKIVTEADEYDRSMLTLHPDTAVITSADADHLDIYGTKEKMIEAYSAFGAQVKSGGNLILKKGLENKLTINSEKLRPHFYSAKEKT